jgi:hypothetical protein
MSSKNSRSGGKYSGNHTTVIPAAGMICDSIYDIVSITKISTGYIKAGLRSARGKRRVKISNDTDTILITVRDNTSTQEIYVYSNNLKTTREEIRSEISKLNLILN